MHLIHERIRSINAEQSQQYVADDSARRRYWAKHPTYFACIKCMDGRVHLPVITKMPIGLIKPFRAIGGKFEIWWPTFLGRMRAWVQDALRHGKRNCVLVTYHFSDSEEHLCCAGWNYHTEHARNHAVKLAQDLSFVFGEQMTTLVAGVETDRDEIVLHGLSDVAGRDLIGLSEEQIVVKLSTAFPSFTPDIAADLAPILKGNAERVAELQTHPCPHTDLMHNERIIAVGKGFDWLAEKNLALIINDADPNLAESVHVAASLIEKNLKNSPMGDDASLFTNILYKEPGIDYRQAIARSKGLLSFVEQVVHTHFPSLVSSGHLHALCGVTWEPNKKLEILESR